MPLVPVHHVVLAHIVVGLALLTGCDTTPQPSPEPGPCIPSADAYAANAAPILNASCSECHGSTPQFGAPYSLVDGYADLVAGEVGSRKVDAIVAELEAATMPPATSPQLSHGDLDTLVGWASCGLTHPDPASNLTVNRPVWEAAAEPPAGTTAVELLADEETVGLDAIDDYRTFTFSSVVDHSQYIRRIEPVIDESRVLHHITLSAAGGVPYLYAWAPGTGAIDFPDGGMRVEPGDGFELEIHYNNGAGIPDAVDSSGVRMWVGEVGGTEFGMMSPVTWDILVPAGQDVSVTQRCRATMDFEIIAGMPHMHQIGSYFVHDVEHADGTVTNLVELSGWSFEAQFFYAMNTQVRAGDELTMTCGYHNPTEQTVEAGQGTADEMCFDFLVVTPAAAATQCSEE